ncbi:unnamed protein product [Spirodela intermedia]|uniref:Uncharacterized protein n=1 Tax=Spirodela intermedia TaxID=51605 RepID=A0A7I8K6K0_SPIIN|nr:unnamed protein product [Spirodela intermedia]
MGACVRHSPSMSPTTSQADSNGERDPSPSAQETPSVRVQPDRRAKTKEPGFRYTA